MSIRTWRTRAVAGALVLVIGATLLAGCSLTGVVQVQVSDGHACALIQDGTVRCWGRNTYGDLGRGYVSPSTPDQFNPTPAPVIGVSGATAIAVGSSWGCAILADTSVMCWGGGSGTATAKAGLTGAVALALGQAHGCALLEDATVSCWGLNNEGQLGLGNTSPVGPLPIPVPGLSDVVAVDAGPYSTCAVLGDGTARCWGLNDTGQLGTPSPPATAPRTLVPTTIPGLAGVAGISTGAAHTCANLDDGTAQCWGMGLMGQLGRGTLVNGYTPAPVVGLTGVTGISVAGSWSAGNSCATLDDGTARCWGYNTLWQLGDLTSGNRSLPTPVANLTGVDAISVGGSTTCAAGGGGVSCWGSDHWGALGLGPVAAPTGVVRPVVMIEGATAVAAGASSSCAVIDDGSVRCWGTNVNGQAGTAVDENTVWPSTVASVAGASAISSNDGSCALVDDGTAWCWGGVWVNAGSTSPPMQQTAAPVGPGWPPSDLTITGVSVGGTHRCVLLSSGSIRCSGINTAGQLGDGGPTNQYIGRTATVSGITDATAVHAGPSNSCAVRQDATVACWGANGSGQLGNGTVTAALSPVAVSGLTGVSNLSGAGTTVCAVVADTTVRCWGDNASGQVGDGTTVNRTTPVAVPGLSGVVKVSATSGHTCALLDDGTARCWGRNDLGQLGTGAVGAASSTPVVVDLTGMVDISTSSNNTCAVRTDGTVWCWGGNDGGKGGSGLRGTFPAAVVASL